MLLLCTPGIQEENCVKQTITRRLLIERISQEGTFFVVCYDKTLKRLCVVILLLSTWSTENKLATPSIPCRNLYVVQLASAFGVTYAWRLLGASLFCRPMDLLDSWQLLSGSHRFGASH
jgi:hypothetical protein